MADDGEPEAEDLWARLRREHLSSPTVDSDSGAEERAPAGASGHHDAPSPADPGAHRPTQDPGTGMQQQVGTEHTEAQVVIGEVDTPAVRQIKAWVARRTRTQMVALVLVSLLALGPLLALVMVMRTNTSPIDELITPDTPDPTVTSITTTLTSMSPTQGEVRARFTVEPSLDLVDEDGRLFESLSIVANGTTTELREGESVRPFEVTLAIGEGSVTRYPFDRYRGQLLLLATTGTGEEREFVPFVPKVHSVVGDFTVHADLSRDPAAEDDPIGVVDWSALRPATTSIYAIWLMVLMWALAVTGLLIVWSVIMWMVELPMWVFGYFVGVLFALPPLRDSLPGRPPPGNLFDFLSFYWSVTIIGVSLILSLSTWLTRTRAEQRLRALDTGMHERITGMQPAVTGSPDVVSGEAARSDEPARSDLDDGGRDRSRGRGPRD